MAFMTLRGGVTRRAASLSCALRHGATRAAALTLGTAALLAGCAQPANAPSGNANAVPVPTVDQSALGRRGFFYAGGTWADLPDGRHVMSGAMYVEVLVPRAVRHPWPLVFFHGSAQTATNWMQTPDGRMGWADYFVQQGYVVYLVDQPARGRSSYFAKTDGEQVNFPAEQEEKQFTDLARQGTWPSARQHDQWPGEGALRGKRGDPVFDAFYKSQVQFLASNASTQRMVRDASVQLLDRIGPAILVTHSQAGPFGWLIADARPQLVKGIVAIEPAGPPFTNPAILGGAPARQWGLADIPLHYLPETPNAADLKPTLQAAPDAAGLDRCMLQGGEPRKLPNLGKIPTAIVITQASYMSQYGHCTARYLDQAGVKNDFIRLADVGVAGNGHLVMLEKNNLQAAAVLDDWIARKVPQ